MTASVSSIDNFQRQGIAIDIIREALDEYASYCVNDDYDAEGALSRIMGRMAERAKPLL